MRPEFTALRWQPGIRSDRASCTANCAPHAAALHRGQDPSVVPGSTPVVAFGNARVGRVATLGLNPSRIEFWSNGRELDGPKRRLGTMRSLGVDSLQDAAFENVQTVVDESDRYFQRNPYRRWFDPLDEILRSVGATNYGKDANACHLDLVQWATDETWGKLDRPARERLLSEDLPFLLDQLRGGAIHLLLVNGSGVLRVLEDAVPCSSRRAGGSSSAARWNPESSREISTASGSWGGPRTSSHPSA